MTLHGLCSDPARTLHTTLSGSRSYGVSSANPRIRVVDPAVTLPTLPTLPTLSILRGAR